MYRHTDLCRRPIHRVSLDAANLCDGVPDFTINSTSNLHQFHGRAVSTEEVGRRNQRKPERGEIVEGGEGYRGGGERERGREGERVNAVTQ